MRPTRCAIAALLLMTFWQVGSRADDQIEFLNGTTVSGKILSIRKADREFDFQVDFGGRQIDQTHTYEKVHAVTWNGKRFVINPMKTIATSGESTQQRSKSEVLQYIEDIGSTDPDWLASTQPNYPATLDLDWPLKADGKWNESKNVGQYIWGRVSPNVSRWKPAIKMIYEIMDRHQGNHALLQRDMEKLGEMYFVLFQDYARAAYWLQKSKASVSKETGIYLAECYWRLGNKDMALALLRGKSIHFTGIKVLGDMDEIDKAMSVANVYAKTSFFNEAFLKAGDALRGAGRLEEAIAFYQRVLDRNSARNPEYLKRYRGLATGAIEAINLFDKADVSRVADGTYLASSMGYNGQIEVEVKVASSKITSVKVTQHREKQFYAALTDTPRQIMQTQGFQNIDGTSGATITSQAIINSTAQAMAKGTQ
ncbi:MAG: FMN-binding protein [Pirellulaceae bacterium]